MYMYMYMYMYISGARVWSPQCFCWLECAQCVYSWTRTLLGGLWKVHNCWETCATSLTRARHLWNMHNIADTRSTSLKRAQHHWNVHNIFETCTYRILENTGRGGETRYTHIYIHLQYAHVLIHAFRHASTHHTIWSHAYNDWNTVTDTRLASYWIAVDAMTWNFVTWHDKHPCMNAYIQSHKYTYCVYTYVYSFCFFKHWYTYVLP